MQGNFFETMWSIPACGVWGIPEEQQGLLPCPVKMLEAYKAKSALIGKQLHVGARVVFCTDIDHIGEPTHQ